MPDLRPSPLDLARKVATRARSRGAREVVRLAVDRAREAWHSEATLVFYVRDLQPGSAPEPPPGASVRPATPDDAARYARDIGTDSPRTFRRRLSAHTRCWLMLEGEKVLHATWTTSRAAWTRELRCYFRPPSGDLYVYESFTRADARGRGAYPLVLEHLCRDAAASGLRRAWVGVEGDNAPSIRAVTKAGFSPAFEVQFARRRGTVHIEPARGDRLAECNACLGHRPEGVVGRRG